MANYFKCVICNRPLDKAEFFIGGYPVGSTCAKNRGLTKGSYSKSIAIKNDQKDLFEELENDTKEKTNE